MGFGEMGFGEVCFGEVGFGEMGFGEMGFGEVGFGEVGFGEMGFGEVGFGEVGFGEMDGNLCQLIPLKLWQNTAPTISLGSHQNIGLHTGACANVVLLTYVLTYTYLQGCNHQSTCMPQLQPLCSAALVPNVLPRRDEGSGKPCGVIEAL